MQAAGSIYSVELGNLEAHTECIIRLSYLRQVRCSAPSITKSLFAVCSPLSDPCAGAMSTVWHVPSACCCAPR